MSDQPNDECTLCGGMGEYEETRPASPSESNGGLSEESRWVVCPCAKHVGPRDRDRDEDDGQTYADPRDEMADRLDRD